MKGRDLTDLETIIIKNFFTQDIIRSGSQKNELDAMIMANEITLAKDTDFIIYDITENIKHCIIVLSSFENFEFNSFIEEFLIDIDNKKIVAIHEIENLLLQQIQKS
jgi:hypothetical protein